MTNHFSNPKHALLLMVAFAAILIIGMASAGTYYGENASIKIKNKGEKKYTSAKLAWYADTVDGQCNDSDSGFKPKTPGYMFFTDPATGTGSVVMEQCMDSKKLIELSCVKNVSVEGTTHDKQGYVLVTIVDCAKKCETTPISQGLPRGYCKD